MLPALESIVSRRLGAPAVNSITGLVLALAVSAFGPEATAFQPVSRQGAINSEPALPRRALLQLGTDDLRMTQSITAVAFSPDGRLAAAADANASSPRIAIFDVRTGRRARHLVAPAGQPGWVESIAFSPDGAKILWGEISGQVALWDLAANRLIHRGKLHEGEVKSVAFSPDGHLLASTGGGTICVRGIARPEENARVIAIGPRPGPAAPQADIPPLGGREERSASLAFTPDSTRLVAGTCADAKLFVWRIADGRTLRTIASARPGAATDSENPALNFVAITPDSRRIMSVGQTTKLRSETALKFGPNEVPMSEVRFWDIETGACVADYHGDDDSGFGYGTLSQDGRRVAVADFSRLRILDAATGHVQRSIDLPGSPGRPPTLSPDGTVVAMPIDHSVALFEVSTGRRLQHDASKPDGNVSCAAWSPSGDRIVTGNADGFIRVWNSATGKLIWHKQLAPVISRSGLRRKGRIRRLLARRTALDCGRPPR